MRSAHLHFRTGFLAVAAFSLAGCNFLSGGGEEDTARSVEGVPAIWGEPLQTAIVSSSYSFTPEVEDSDGDVLQFAIANKPGWTTFDEGTGTMQGTPTSEDIGTHENVVISVSDGRSIISLPSFSIRVSLTEAPVDETTSDGASRPPALSGSPNPSVVVDSMYSFQPDAVDPDGDALSFSIVNKPLWATFDTTTGRLEGRPGDGDIGMTEGIDMTATDGQNVVSLSRFGISVQATGLSSFTLSWAPPTANEDGTPLMDLAGYRVYYGTRPGDYSEVVELNSPGLTTYTLENLAAGDYFLAMTSYNTSNVESDYSQEISFGAGS